MNTAIQQAKATIEITRNEINNAIATIEAAKKRMKILCSELCKYELADSRTNRSVCNASQEAGTLYTKSCQLSRYLETANALLSI